MNNWILVSERLPEENKKVLITFLGYNDKQPRCGVAYIKNGYWLWCHNDKKVIVEIVAWQYVEPCKIIKLTDDERKLLEVAYNRGFRWVARDNDIQDAHIHVFESKPRKKADFWDDDRDSYVRIFDDMLIFIKWKDEEPYSIEELLKGWKIK